MASLDPTRAQRLTASKFPRLLRGEPADLQQLWLQLVGDPRAQQDDFANSWESRYGMTIEPLALDWHQEQSGEKLIRRGEQLFHPQRPHVSCTLDAYRQCDDTVIDCKCVNAWRDLDAVIAYYAPQIVCQQACAGAAHGALLVVRGGARPFEVPIIYDQDYANAVWDAVDRFWACVESLTPPVPLYFPQLVPPEQWRTVDLDADDAPNWADDMRELLEDWAQSKSMAGLHEHSKTEIKKLLPDDVGRVTHGNIIIARTRTNAVRITYKGENHAADEEQYVRRPRRAKQA